MRIVILRNRDGLLLCEGTYPTREATAGGIQGLALPLDTGSEPSPLESLSKLLVGERTGDGSE